MAYDVDGLKKDWPVDRLRPRNLGSSANPTLQDMLVHGHLSELCRLILDRGLEEPYASIALCAIPSVAMMAAAMQKAEELFLQTPAGAVAAVRVAKENKE